MDSFLYMQIKTSDSSQSMTSSCADTEE